MRNASSSGVRLIEVIFSPLSLHPHSFFFLQPDLVWYSYSTNSLFPSSRFSPKKSSPDSPGLYINIRRQKFRPWIYSRLHFLTWAVVCLNPQLFFILWTTTNPDMGILDSVSSVLCWRAPCTSIAIAFFSRLCLVNGRAVRGSSKPQSHSSTTAFRKLVLRKFHHLSWSVAVFREQAYGWRFHREFFRSPLWDESIVMTRERLSEFEATTPRHQSGRQRLSLAFLVSSVSNHFFEYNSVITNT